MSDDPREPSIPEEDRLARQEVLSFLASRYERASLVLPESQWTSFRSFVGLWLETYDWRTAAGASAYLGLEPSQRRARFDRFRRQAESWDVTLEFPADASDDREAEGRHRWRREFAERRERMRRRRAREESRWEAVRRLLEAEHARRRVPTELLEAFELLGLPPEASLAEARQRYRHLARRRHPDASGSTEEMVSLNRAWEQVREFFLS